MKKRWYIAYGSNLNLRQMAMRCPALLEGCMAILPDRGRGLIRIRLIGTS